MDFAPRPRKSRSESIVPMINVVFLLLIFFLMTAQIAPPAPFAVDPPQAETGDPAEGPLVLYLSARGEIAFHDLRGPAALTALAAAAAPPDTPVLLRADAQVAAATLAQLLPRLARLGLTQVHLITATTP